jgi:DNA-binding CsgD family transcriptional regulator
LKQLSPREREVVELLIGGLTQKEIACQLCISPHTVFSYLRRVQIKTEQPTILSAIVFVLIKGEVLVNST